MITERVLRGKEDISRPLHEGREGVYRDTGLSIIKVGIPGKPSSKAGKSGWNVIGKTGWTIFVVLPGNVKFWFRERHFLNLGNRDQTPLHPPHVLNRTNN